MGPEVSRMGRCGGLGLGDSGSWVRDFNSRHPGLCVTMRQAASWWKQGYMWCSMNPGCGAWTRRGQGIQGASDLQQFIIPHTIIVEDGS